MIYIDQPHKTNYKRFKTMSHMMTDGDINELHLFAAKLGLKYEWFQDHKTHPHYDLFDSRIAAAIRCGATIVSSIELLERCSIRRTNGQHS